MVSGCSPEVLGSALQRARGEIVVVTNASCRFPPDWLAKVVRIHPDGVSVIGGAIAYLGSGTVTSWATYFADYGAFMPTKPRSKTRLLAGNHVCYKRSLIQESAASLASGYRKTPFHWDLIRRGNEFMFEPELSIGCLQEQSARTFAAGYFHKGKSFARLRSTWMGKAERLGRIASAPWVALLLLLRRTIAVWTTRQCRFMLIRTIPLQTFFVVCWTAGESAGYCLGPTGGSDRRQVRGFWGWLPQRFSRRPGPS